jgi:excisionase family DNA binding protein
MTTGRDWRINPMKKLTNSPPSPLLGQQSVSPHRADFLTIQDWAQRLKISTRSVHRMIDQGAIPRADLATGKTRRWHEATYQRWVSDNVGGN